MATPVLTTESFYISRSKQSVIFAIQDDDPSYDPVRMALIASRIPIDMFKNACDRVYIDGNYGPINDQEWKETEDHRRGPYSVKESLDLIAKVLAEVEDYNTSDDEGWDEMYVSAETIRTEIVYWYSDIYGVRYPSV